jgi:hypothetical protein
MIREMSGRTEWRKAKGWSLLGCISTTPRPAPTARAHGFAEWLLGMLAAGPSLAVAEARGVTLGLHEPRAEVGALGSGRRNVFRELRRRHRRDLRPFDTEEIRVPRIPPRDPAEHALAAHAAVERHGGVSLTVIVHVPVLGPLSIVMFDVRVQRNGESDAAACGVSRAIVTPLE